MLKMNPRPSQQVMADILGKNRSSICREIKRGSVTQIKQGKSVQVYYADSAQRQYQERRINSRARSWRQKYDQRFFNELKVELTRKLRVHSVDTFVHYYKVLHPNGRVPSTKTVYNIIDSNECQIKNYDLPKKMTLRVRKGSHKGLHGKNKKVLGTSIEERDPSVLERHELGHWEGDLVKGKKTKDEPATLSLLERVSRYYVAIKIPDASAATVKKALQDFLDKNELPMKTITWDNGSEFAKVTEVTSDVKMYYAHAYASWERGGNERHNGLYREFVPKGQSQHQYSDEYIKSAADALNNRPRRILNYKTPNQVIMEN
jgi:IS30 family transposase